MIFINLTESKTNFTKSIVYDKVKFLKTKKIFIFIFIFLFSFNFCLAQNSVEKWNQYLNRYEYFDAYGSMTAYKTFNSYKQQWEVFTVQNNNSGYRIQPAQESVNVPLVQNTLSTLQESYDYNLDRIKEQVKTSTYYLYACAKSNGYSYNDTVNGVNAFNNTYVNKIQNGGYDLSSNSLTEKLLRFLSDGSFKIACEYFKECN